MPDFSNFLQTWFPILLAFLIGSIPFGLLVAKMKGVDIREHGSGNIGSTNVSRALGKSVGVLVLILDILKGLVPVLIAKMVSDNSVLHILIASATIVGHNYTPWLKFKGGKGIATTAGAMLLIAPIALVTSLSTWGAVTKISRYVSLGSIAAAVAIPVTIVIQNFITGKWDMPILGFGLFLCLMAIWRHRGNIIRLLRGEENRFEKKQKPAK